MPSPLRIVGTALVLMGLAAMVRGGYGLATRHDGEILEAQATVVAHSAVTKEVVVGGRGERRSVAFTKIRLAYVVDGKQHEWVVERAPSLAAAQFPLGAKMIVYLPAERPDEASLSRDRDPYAVVLIVAGVLLLISGAAIFLLGKNSS